MREIGATCEAPYPKGRLVRDIPLKICPFCGGEARVRIVNAYTTSAYRVQCENCHIGTAIVSVGMYLVYRGKYDKSFTDDEAVAEAARIWNERSEE